MKKILSILFVIAMLVLPMAGMVSAQTDGSVASYTFSDVSGYPGKEVYVEFSLKTEVAVNTIGVKDFTYDRSALELVGFEKAESFDAAICEYDEDKQVLAVATFEASTVDAVVGSFVFKIKEGAVPGASLPVSATTFVTKNSSTSYGSEVYEGSVSVSVYVTGVSLNKTSLSLEKGQSETLTATVIPENANNKNITWATSNESVATVVNGKVTAVGAGTAEITVTTQDGAKSASCSVTVTEPPVIDENAPSIVVENVVSRAGNTVDVDISIKNNPGIVAMLFTVEYDEDLTLVGIKNGTVLNGPQHNPNGLNKNPYTVNFAEDTAFENNTNNGTIITLTFKVAEGAELGVAPITVSYEKDNSAIYDVDFKDVHFEVINGGVEIISYIVGDLDDDGKVNQKDRTTLARHLANWDGYEETTFNYAAADVNEDGKVNQQDRTILARHLADWEGYETLPFKN